MKGEFRATTIRIQPTRPERDVQCDPSPEMQLPSANENARSCYAHFFGIRRLHKRGMMTAEFDITPELWFFACHFQGIPSCLAALGWMHCGKVWGFPRLVQTTKAKAELLALGRYVSLAKSLQQAEW